MNGTFIYNETPSGTIDGVNKEFTTINTIERIEEVYVGGVVYRNVSFAGNVITLTDAPPTGTTISVDYFVEDLTTPTAVGSVVFSDLIEEVYDIIGQEQTSESYPIDMVKRYINKGIQKIKNEKYFKEKVYQYTFNKAKDRSAVGYDANSITIVDTDYIPSTGALLLTESSYVEYSTYVDGVFGATPGFVYKGGDKVAVGYKLLSGVKRVSEVLMNGNPLTYVDHREFNMAYNNNFTIIHSTDGNRYLFLPYTDEAVIDVKYVPDYTMLVNDDDVVDIDYEYSDAISLYSAYKVLVFREDDRWQALKQEFLEEKTRLKAFKARVVDSVNNGFNTSGILNNE